MPGLLLDSCKSFSRRYSWSFLLTLDFSAFDDFFYLVQKYVPWEDGSAEWEQIRGK